MARKSRETIEREEAERQAKIDDAVNVRFADLKTELVQQLAAQLSAARQANGTSTAPDIDAAGDRGLIQSLAMEIAKISDPSNKRRTVSPEVAKAREEARERMQALLVQAHANKEMPVYIVRNKIYLREVKIEPQYRDAATNSMKNTEINWPGVPNEAMEPANEIAGKIHTEFLLSIGSVGKAPVRKAPWVISGKEIVRGHAGGAPQVGTGSINDPRRPGASSIPIEKTIRVLGTAAEAAIVGP